MSRPKFKHVRVQKQLEELFEPAARGKGKVIMEFPFRPLPEHEFWSADMAFISKGRWEQIDPEDNLFGAPELVIEVLSPSNTAAEINDKEKLCLENGCLEFWVVYLRLRQVKVSTPGGLTTTFRTGQEIPLRIFSSGSLKVDTIFD